MSTPFRQGPWPACRVRRARRERLDCDESARITGMKDVKGKEKERITKRGWHHTTRHSWSKQKQKLNYSALCGTLPVFDLRRTICRIQCQQIRCKTSHVAAPKCASRNCAVRRLLSNRCCAQIQE